MGSLRIGPPAFAAAILALAAAAAVASAAFERRVDPPQATITVAPPARIVVHGGGTATATWEFAADQPGAKFTCKFPGNQIRPCRSPMTYPGLTKGSYTFTVYAVDLLVDPDTTRARSTVEVVKKRR